MEPDLVSIRGSTPVTASCCAAMDCRGGIRRQIREMLSRGDPTGAVTALVEAAIERGAPDNVTCGGRRRAVDTPDRQPPGRGRRGGPRLAHSCPASDFRRTVSSSHRRNRSNLTPVANPGPRQRR